MKRIFFTVLMILVLGVSVSYAQKAQPFICFRGGAAVPVTPKYFRTTNAAITAGACFGVSISEKQVDLYVSVDYIGFESYYGRFWTIFVNGKFNLMSKKRVSPYFVIGIGSARWHIGSRLEHEFGMHGSLGVSIAINEKVSWLIEGDYVDVNTEGDAIGFFNGRAGFFITL